MNSSLPPAATGLLKCLGFSFVKSDARTCKEHWLSQEMLPHIEVTIEPTEECFTGDIIRAIFDAGARDQRERTRTAFNRLVESFRNGQAIEPAEDLLHLTEPS